MESSVLALICPTYLEGDFAWSCLDRCLDSFLRYTPQGLALWLDDASPDWREAQADYWRRRGVLVQRFEQNHGLTAVWNHGLRWSRDLGCRWAATSNFDVIFSSNWSVPLISGLQQGYALMGPVTNAPGAVKNQGAQQIRTYLPNYSPSDKSEDIEETASSLYRHQGNRLIEAGLNGFCLLSTVERWFKGAFRGEDVFDPRYRMQGNEDELQRRWKSRGWRSAVGCGSFVFHYRSVARGERYLSPGFFRPPVKQ